MSSKIFLAILAAYCLLASTNVQPASAASCKCGGAYAGGTKVTGCQNDQCVKGGDTRCVVIYKNQKRTDSIIGYDCLPWPAQVADCATFDDGSRICALETCKSTLTGQRSGSDCQVELADGGHAEIAVQLSRGGLQFIMDTVNRQVQVEVAKLRIPNQQIHQVGLDIKASNIKITQITIPKLSYTLSPPSGVVILAKGGDFKLCADWEAKKSILSSSGTACVWSEKKAGIDASVSVNASVTQNGTLRVNATGCAFNMPVDMELTGFVGSVVNLARSWIEDAIQKEASNKFCQVVSEAVRGTVNAILQELPRTFNVDARYGLKYTFAAITTNDKGLRVQASVNGTFHEK